MCGDVIVVRKTSRNDGLLCIKNELLFDYSERGFRSRNLHCDKTTQYIATPNSERGLW